MSSMSRKKRKVESDNQCWFFSVQISYIFRIKMTPRRLPLISATGALTDLRYSTGLVWFTMDYLVWFGTAGLHGCNHYPL